ncbi:hypothetical protein CapIbe_024282, partial [Capra ibex]
SLRSASFLKDSLDSGCRKDLPSLTTRERQADKVK